ncbi:MAG TPA: hypothetical protein PLD25_31305 [Chloroflexota bacterium]|nr:hypothetical protein [Chloroflexota bacterium]HUM69759.1 hypothetical protein [Chloroflexota bacterium]
MMINGTLLETIQTLQYRAERLEQEAALLRQELAHVVQRLVDPLTVVATYLIQGETYQITQADVEAVQSKMTKPHPDEALRELALAKKMAERVKHLSREEKAARLLKTVENSRAMAIADGTAIENEYETAIDD